MAMRGSGANLFDARSPQPILGGLDSITNPKLQAKLANPWGRRPHYPSLWIGSQDWSTGPGAGPLGDPLHSGAGHPHRTGCRDRRSGDGRWRQPISEPHGHEHSMGLCPHTRVGEFSLEDCQQSRAVGCPLRSIRAYRGFLLDSHPDSGPATPWRHRSRWPAAPGGNQVYGRSTPP
jgi:hypothetical protein